MLRLRKSQTENHANGGTMNRIQSIHYLRGIAALLVVAYHNRSFSYEHYTGENWTEVLFQGGAFGVDLFFLISGFIIAYSTRRAEHSHLSDYVLRRFFRIYPVFWLVLGFVE
ncbi:MULTISPECIES: acyltransferase family protein [Pantoea]|jgi:exopolysaccharide production protein ExoZ|uniref:Acyltransferase n=1 Tax=Pantoea brenneri TaxID=472694 RepID=A0A7Y6TTS9_9GAMM|nr:MULTISPECIES: acyltransferase [Pantoea]MBZ6397130.1 acyltransferase [Pantoea sp.]MBZ6440350.1 acyltransferase [Pantoea sp.]NUY43563.1 acyltransferase [Pantoea brenneri]NUY51035.1 acyltransferase [Pantoea brenneri]NUY61328.1 acyltransferase [Pantoea brenneri]